MGSPILTAINHRETSPILTASKQRQLSPILTCKKPTPKSYVQNPSDVNNSPRVSVMDLSSNQTPVRNQASCYQPSNGSSSQPRGQGSESILEEIEKLSRCNFFKSQTRFGKTQEVFESFHIHLREK